MVIGVPDTGMGEAPVIYIRPVVGVAYRLVIPAVRPVVYQAEPHGRTDEISVIRPIHIMPVIDVYEAGIVAIYTSRVIEDMKSAETIYPSVAISDIDSANLGDTSVIIIVYRYILYLNDGPVIIVLHIRIVVIAGVEGDCSTSKIYTGSHLNPVIYVEVKLTVRIYRKGNPVFYKYEGVPVRGREVIHRIYG